MAANNDCEAAAPDASNFRSNGCAFAGDDCPIKGKMVNDELAMKFFAEQANDADKKWKDEMIHFHNPSSGRSNEGGDGNAKRLQDRQNVHDGHAEGDEFITQNPRAAKSDRAENCTANGGRITGIGPSCDVGERGEGDLHNCIFEKISYCEALRQSCRGNVSYDNMSSLISNNVDVAQPPVSVSPNCDDYYKSCVEKTTALCICSDCEYESCLYDCDDDAGDEDGDDDDVDDTTTDTELNEGPKLKSVRFTNSAYDIPIPILYGRYVVSGNIIWASEPTQTLVTERTESVDERRVRVQISERTIYHGSFALAICEGPISGLVRVWLGETLLFSHTLNVNDAGIVEPTSGVLVDEIENMILFSADSADEAYYDQTRMRATLFPGNEDQLPSSVMGEAQPGYRGLAYLLFENVNLSYMGGNVPQIRVEISEFDTSVTFPRIVSNVSQVDLGDVRTDLLYADVRSNSLYVAADPAPGRPTVTAGFRKLRFDTLEEVSYYYDGVADFDPATFALMTNGIVVYQQDTGTFQRKTFFIRPETNTLLDDLGSNANLSLEGAVHVLPSTLGALGPATRSVQAYKAGTYAGAERFYSVDLVFAISQALSYTTMHFDEETSAAVVDSSYLNMNDAGTICYAPCEEACADAHCVVTEDEELEGGGSFLECDEPAYSDCLNDCDDLCFGGSLDTYTPFASILNEVYYLPDNATIEVYKRKQFIDIFTMQASAQPSMKIARVKYGDTATSGAVLQVQETAIDVPASVWGGQTSGVSGLFVINDKARSQAVVFLADGAGGAFAFALQTPDYTTVNWSVFIPDFLAYTSNGERMLPYPADDFLFIDGNGDVVGLDLTTGDLDYSFGNVVAEGLPMLGGAQLYDPGRNAITYVGSDATVVRIFPNRTIPGLVPISGVIQDICERAGIDTDYIDVSDLTGITVTGIGVFDNTSPSAVISQLMTMFSLSVIEQDGLIVFRRTHVGDDFALDESELLSMGGMTYQRVEADTYVEPKRLTLTYADIDNFCRAAYQMANQQISALYTINAVSHVRIETSAALDAQTAAEVAERIYARLHARVNRIEFGMSAAVLRWAVNDYVTITFDDAGTRRYRITDITFDPTRGKMLVRAEDDITHLSLEDLSIVPWEDPAKFRVQQAFRKLQTQTVRMFTATPFTDADMLASATHHVFYVGVQSALEANEFPETGIDFKPLNGSDIVHERGPTLTGPLQIGRAVTLLPADTGEFDTDYTTEFQVRFARDDIEPFLNNATKAALLEDRTRNCLLVGREWIQYQNVSYDSGTGIATFSGLFRGRNGTDTYVFRHNIGEEVILPTPGSFKPIYVHYRRMTVSQSISLRLRSLQTVQVSGKPIIFATNADSIRPWAPANAHRYQSGSDVVVTFAYRGKHDDDDLVDGADVPTFEPTPEIYGENRSVTTGSYVRMYVAYFTTRNDDYNTVEAMIRAREENGNSVTFGYSRSEANTDTEARLAAGSFASAGPFNPATDVLNVYLAQIGGPANNKVGFVSKFSFPPGTYTSIPLGPKMRVRKATTYAVLSPDNLKVYATGTMLVLRP